ncbi:MAG: NADH-ubiquinone oxidoreductase-F iron-sulfur binding region domain-containing protein [Eubacteriales bacterium]|nr:NADH-ubiquinone oxidoreductase-F iron-sulfur binding region domain-containing protein [Eubacteriales bacterium]
MSALENAKALTGAEILKKIADLGLVEQGVYAGSLADLLAAAVAESKEEGVEIGVACGLNNADTDYVLLGILKNAPEKVMEGIAVAALAVGAEKKTLYVPESEKALADELAEKAAAYGIAVSAEFINVRANKGSAMIHIATAADLADAFDDSYVPGVYVFVGEELKKVSATTKIADLVDVTGAKAIEAGYKLYTPAEEPTAAAAVNGVIRVLTDKDCVVSAAEKKVTACRQTSCGKCVFCREGLIQLQYMNREITQGRGKAEFIDLAKEIGEAMEISTLCSMGQESAKYTLDAIAAFEDEYMAHIKKKQCPAGECQAFINFYIDPNLCNGCAKCTEVCADDGLEGLPGYIYIIDEFNCTKCRKCEDVCPVHAIKETTGRVPKLPDRLTRVGRFRAN